MGQTESLPTEGRVTPPIDPPTDWNNQGADFELISPVSDISNPSQFRHRLPPASRNTQQQSQTVKRSARRASKVWTGKTPPRRRHRTMPPPQKFHFPTASEIRVEQDLLDQANGGTRGGTLQPRWKICRRRWQQKCSHAKRRMAVLANCHKQHKESEEKRQSGQDVPQRDPQVLHRRLTDTTSAKEEESYDPLVGLTVNKDSFEHSVSALHDVTFNRFAMLDKRESADTDQGTIDNDRMTPYLQLLQKATMSPPNPRQGHHQPDTVFEQISMSRDTTNAYDDEVPHDEQTADSIRKNSTEDSVILGGSSNSSSSLSKDSSSDSPDDAKMVVGSFQPISREQTQPSTNLFEHSPAGYLQRLVDVTNSSPGESENSPNQEEPRNAQVNTSMQSPVMELFASSAIENLTAQRLLDTNQSAESSQEENTVLDSHKAVEPTRTSVYSKESMPSSVKPMKSLSVGGSDAESVHQDKPSIGNKGSFASEETEKTRITQKASFASDVSETPTILASIKKQSIAAAKNRRSSLSSQQPNNANCNRRSSVSHANTLFSSDNGELVSPGLRSVLWEQAREGKQAEDVLRDSGIATNRRSSVSNANTLFSSDNGELVSPGLRSLLLDQALVSVEGARVSRLRQQFQRQKAARLSVESDTKSEATVEQKVAALEQKASILLKEPKSTVLSNDQAEKENQPRRSRWSEFQSRRSSILEKTKRSASSPPKLKSHPYARDSVQLPGLLHMAGWKEPPKQQVVVAKKEVPQTKPKTKKVSFGPGDEVFNKPQSKKIVAKLKRSSDPGPAPRTGSGITTAAMLKQTYSFSQVLEEEKKQHGEDIRRTSAPSAMETTDYRLIALGGQMGSPRMPQSTALVPTESPCLSVDSTSTNGSVPMLSQQAMYNAAFLFSPSYAGGDEAAARPQRISNHSDAMSFSITTLGSRARVTSAVEAVTIPASRASSLTADSNSQQSGRRVRFSDADDIFAVGTREDKPKPKTHQPEEVEIPAIVRNFSDLTDTSIPEARESNFSAGAIDSIPEENESTAHVSFNSQENSLVIFEDEHGSDEKGPRMQWGYSGGDNGVTPLRSGKSIAHATNSPFLRFQEARNKFNSATSSTTSSAAESYSSVHQKIKEEEQEQPNLVEEPEQDSPNVDEQIEDSEEETNLQLAEGKQIEPTGSSLVHSRIAAMEEASGHLVLGEGGILQLASSESQTAKPSYLLHKGFSTDLAHSASFPETSSAPRIEENRRASHSALSPTLIDGEVVDSIRQRSETWKPRESKESLDESKAYSVGDFDNFADIMHPTAIDSESEDDAGKTLTDLFKSHRAVIENDESSDESTSDDDFDELLNYDQEDFDGDEDSEANETVSTVRQDPSRLGNHFSSYRLSMGDQSTVCSSVGESTVSTVPTVRQIRESIESKRKPFTSVSSGNVPRLPFREQAPVKPNQLNHKSPMKPRTWRALAAAAQEREKNKRALSSKQVNGNHNSLSARNMSVLGR